MKAKIKPFTEEMCMNESPAPITETDTLNIADKEKSININGPMGDVAFLTSENTRYRRVLEDKVRSYIKLSVPVINTLITGADNGLARKILNLSSTQMNDIISGQIIYDTYNDEFISTKEGNETIAGRRYIKNGNLFERYKRREV